MTNDVAVGAFGLNLIGETNESANPFRVLFANDFVMSLASEISDNLLRASFLENVEPCARALALRRLWAEAG